MKKTTISLLFLLLSSLVCTSLFAQGELSMATAGQHTANTSTTKPSGNGPEADIRAMLAAADKGDLEKFMSYWAPSFEIYFNGKLTSAEDLKKRVTVFRTGFPDVKRVIDEVAVSGNVVTARGWITGTNTGKFMDKAATGKSVRAHILCVFRLNANGKVEAGWVDTDMETLKSQLK